MPIIERAPDACFKRFAAHVRELVAETLTRRHPLALYQRGERLMGFSFREREPVAVPIETRFGRLHVYLGQLLEAIPEGKQFRLRTRRYWYRLQAAPELTAKALIRWEYDADMARDGPARHHVQLPAYLAAGTSELDLDKLHLPTGWVTIEEVIRFLIIELGVDPPCAAAWPTVLGDSERAFFEEFTGKRYKPPR